MIVIRKQAFLYNLPNELLFKLCSHLTSNELYQLSLSCQALSRVACDVLSRALILDYAYHDDHKLAQVNEIVNKLKRRSSGFLSDITIAHLSWPVSSELCRRMRHILSLLPNLQTLSLQEEYGSLRGYFIQPCKPESMNTNLYSTLLASPSPTLRRLTISDSRISSHDILKLFSLQQLEHLSIINFNYPMGIEPAPSTPCSQLQSLSISTTAQPTGRHIDIVLARLPNLRRFSWKFDFSAVKTKDEFTKFCSPAAISRAIEPLGATLEDLQVEMVHTGLRGDGTAELCLAGFKKLGRVRVHEEILFPSCEELSYEDFWSGSGVKLRDRLPRSLETLEIISGASRGDQTGHSDEADQTFIFKLPASVKMSLKSLNHVTIIGQDFTTSEKVLEA